MIPSCSQVVDLSRHLSSLAGIYIYVTLISVLLVIYPINKVNTVKHLQTKLCQLLPKAKICT